MPGVRKLFLTHPIPSIQLCLLFWAVRLHSCIRHLTFNKCDPVTVNTMFDKSGTRMILIWTILLGVFSAIVYGKKCDCEAESLSYPDCGIIPTDPTIINGTASAYPWMVFLYLLNDTGYSFCGGSLISDLQVATAAHCVAGKTIDEVGVVLGTEMPKRNTESSISAIFTRSKFIPCTKQ